MTESGETRNAGRTSLAKDAINLGFYYAWRASGGVRRLLGGRRGLILLAVAVVGAGAVLGWDWLVAVGIAPLLVVVAPCAVMCVLGLCMSAGDKSCHSSDRNSGARSRTDLPTTPRDED